MKTIIKILLILLVLVSISACSSGASSSGVSGKSNGDEEIVFSDPKVLADDEYVTIKLVSFSQKNIDNWEGKGKALVKYFAVKVTNNTDEKINFGIPRGYLYVGDESGCAIGASDIHPGKTATISFSVTKGSIMPNEGEQLDSMEELHDVNGYFSFYVNGKGMEYPFDLK